MKRSTIFLLVLTLMLAAFAFTACNEGDNPPADPEECKHERVGDPTVISQPTCTDAGSSNVRCLDCNEIISKVVPPKGHDEAKWADVAATCTQDGQIGGKYCRACGITLVETQVVPKGHTEVIDVALAPDCECPGLTEGKHCSACRATITEQEEVSALGHNFENGKCTTCLKDYFTEGLTYRINDYNVYVTGIGTATDTDIVIPAEYMGKPVISIESDAFKDHTEITSVTFPNTALYIGTCAFEGCTGITELVLPDTIEAVATGAFKNCTSLEKITTPFTTSTKYYDDNATSGGYSQWYFKNWFGGTLPESLKEVTITRGSIEATTKEYVIAEYNFYECTPLEKINLPDGISVIYSDAFVGCTSLTELTIPDSVHTIWNYAFPSSLKKLTTPAANIGSWVYDGTTNFYFLFSSSSNIALEELNITGGRIGKDFATYYNSSSESPFVNLGKLSISGVSTIGMDAFAGCTALKTVVMSDDVTKLEGYTFSNCSELESITLSANLKSIGNYTFYYCRKLESVSLPEGITELNSTFYGCTGLRNLSVPSSVEYVSDNAFRDCTSLVLTTVDMCSYLGNTSNPHLILIKVTSKNANTYSISENTKIIYTNAFEGCIMPLLTVPEGVVQICGGAFKNCTRLENISIPETVTSLGAKPFENCAKLDYYTYDNADYVGSYKNPYLFLIKPTSTSITSCTINERTKYILTGAFRNCTALTSIVIPDSVVGIGEAAFYECTALERVVIGNGVTKLLDGTFSYCSALTSVTIPNSVTFIDGAFSNCTSLESIVIPESVTEIDLYAFPNCTALKSITLPLHLNEKIDLYELIEYTNSEVTTVILTGSGILTDVFPGIETITTVILPEGITDVALTYYNSKLQYNEYDNAYYLGNVSNPYLLLIKAKSTDITSCIINENTKFIGAEAFSECSSLESITIPAGVTKIGAGAFYNCSSLASLTISNGVTVIEDAAFAYCSALTSVVVPDSVVCIGRSVFECCDALESITLPFIGDTRNNPEITHIGHIFGHSDPDFNGAPINLKTVIVTGGTIIGNYAFSHCDYLTCIVLLEGIALIGDYAFANCWSLEHITLPSTVTSIGDHAFYSCYALESINIPDGVTRIGNYAFNYCKKLTSIVLPNSLTELGEYAFYYCEKLSSVTLSASLTEIKEGTFRDTAITEIVIPDSVTVIGEEAFCGCRSLLTVTIGSGVKSIEARAFSYSDNLESVIFKDTAGWSYYRGALARVGTAISAEALSDAATAAKYLEENFSEFYVKKAD